MKKTITLIFVKTLLSVCILKAQAPNPFSTLIFDAKQAAKGEVLDVILAKKNEVIRVYTYKNTQFVLQSFSDNLQYLREKTSSIEPTTLKKAKYQGVIQLQNRTYLLFRKEEGKHFSYKALEIFTDNLTVSDNVVTLCESKKLKPFGLISDNFFAEVRMEQKCYSADKSVFMFAYNDEKEYKNDAHPKIRKDKISINVFDSTLNKIWNKTIEGEYSIKHQKLDIAITNNADVLIYTRGHFDYTSTSTLGNSNNFWGGVNLVIYNKNLNPIIINIPEGYIINDGKIHEDINGNISLVGTYTSDENEKGYYVMELAKSTYEIITKKFYLFGSKILTPDDSVGAYLKAHIKTKSVYTSTDGSTKILFEAIQKASYKSTREINTINTNQSNYLNRTSYYESTFHIYHYGDIVIVSIKDRKNDWERKISKAHKALVTSALSFYSSCSNNEVNIFFNDNLENLAKTDSDQSKEYRDYKEGYLAGVNVTGNGNVSKYNLIEKLPIKTTDFNGNSTNILNISEKQTVYIKVKN